MSPNNRLAIYVFLLHSIVIILLLQQPPVVVVNRPYAKGLNLPKVRAALHLVRACMHSSSNRSTSTCMCEVIPTLLLDRDLSYLVLCVPALRCPLLILWVAAPTLNCLLLKSCGFCNGLFAACASRAVT